MSLANRSAVESLFAAFVAKDLNTVMAQFAADAVMYDPHYPTPLMAGKAAIRSGLEWAFRGMQQPGFTIRNFWAGENNAAAEVDTHHVMLGGLELNFPQAFVFEWRDGLVTRLQAYVPYPPPPMPAA